MVCIILKDEGFLLNKEKTKFMTPKNKKSITGVTISEEKLKAPYSMKKLVRSMIHRAIISGDYSEADRIRGYIAYISSIEDDYLIRIENYIKKFYKDPITLFTDAVKAFNANKLFSKLEDLYEQEAACFVDYDDIDYFESDAYETRQDYLEKHGFIK